MNALLLGAAACTDSKAPFFAGEGNGGSKPVDAGRDADPSTQGSDSGTSEPKPGEDAAADSPGVDAGAGGPVHKPGGTLQAHIGKACGDFTSNGLALIGRLGDGESPFAVAAVSPAGETLDTCTGFIGRVAVAAIRPTDGKLLYINGIDGERVPEVPSGIFEFNVDTFAKDGSTSEWLYPTDPASDDVEVPTPACKGAPDHFILRPDSGSVLYTCGDQVVYEGMKQIVRLQAGEVLWAVNPAGDLFISSQVTQGNPQIWVPNEDGKTEHTIETTDCHISNEYRLFTVRATQRGFMYVFHDPCGGYKLWEVDEHYVPKFVGLFEEAPARLDRDGVGYFLRSDGVYSEVIGKPPKRIAKLGAVNADWATQTTAPTIGTVRQIDGVTDIEPLEQKMTTSPLISGP